MFSRIRINGRIDYYNEENTEKKKDILLMRRIRRNRRIDYNIQ